MFGSMNHRQTVIFSLTFIIIGVICMIVYLITKIPLFLLLAICFLAIGLPIYLIEYFTYKEFGDRY